MRMLMILFLIVCGGCSVKMQADAYYPNKLGDPHQSRMSSNTTAVAFKTLGGDK